jgi:tetratricopeptide (TPR) repeat protein
VRVVLAGQFPGGARPPATEHARWAPDVAATLARFGGAALAGGEGIDLCEAPPHERVMLAWSHAPLDQMGWRPLVAARSGATVRLEGPATTVTAIGGGSLDAQLGERLGTVIAERRAIEGTAVPAATIAPLVGFALDPAPVEGRAFDARREVAADVWAARALVLQRRDAEALAAYDRALARDPDNLGALLGAGQLAVLVQQLEPGRARLRRAVARYPTSPEVVHWYAHAIWSESWQDGARLVEAILPYKPHEADLLYDLACARSIGGRIDESADFLARAIDAGFTQWEQIEADPDLRALRESGRFAEVVRAARQGTP